MNGWLVLARGAGCGWVVRGRAVRDKGGRGATMGTGALRGGERGQRAGWRTGRVSRPSILGSFLIW